MYNNDIYSVEVNEEAKETVIVNFEEMIEEYSDAVDECEDIMLSVEEKFPNLVESVDEPQDAYYIVTCFDEDSAEEIEKYLESKFAQLQEELED